MHSIYLVNIQGLVTAQFGDDAAASSIKWSLFTSSGYPQQDAGVDSVIAAFSDKKLRGTESNYMRVQTTPVYYEAGFNSTSLTGYQWRFLEAVKGSEVGADNFNFLYGLSAQVILEESETVLSISLDLQYTPAVIISLILGLYFGLAGQFITVVSKMDEYFGVFKATTNPTMGLPTTEADKRKSNMEFNMETEEDAPAVTNKKAYLAWKSLSLLLCSAILVVLVVIMFLPVN